VEAGKYELAEQDFDADEIMTAAVRLVREKVERGNIELQVRPPRQLVQLSADRRALLQVLINLLANAVKFTERGSIVLSGELAADGGFTYTVADTGIGMTQAQIKIALQPFGQIQNALTRAQPGTGLGLPLSDRMVQMHGGRLEIRSTPGQGTSVSIHLPPSRVIGAFNVAANEK
ncbi:MAG: ATP-binding protein, partial [Ferrovibrio sp.]